MQQSKEVMELLKENPPKTGLDYAMRVRGITNKELAERLDTEPQNVSNWRNGRVPKTREIMLAVAREMGESVDYLFFQEGGWNISIEERLSS